MDHPPVVVTDDARLLADIQRISAAAGVPISHQDTVDAVGAAAAWKRAPMVLLDVALAAVAADRLPRRDAVTVIASAEPDTAQWAACVAVGARRVVTLGRDDEAILGMLVDAADSGASQSGHGRLVAVVGAVGGAGATVLSVATALAATRADRQTVVVDTDADAAGLEVAAGIESTRGARWGDISAPGGRLSAESLHTALPRVAAAGGDLRALSFGRGGPADLDARLVATVLDAVTRAGGVGVVDVARSAAAVADQVVGRADLTVLVSPAEVRGCYGAARVAARLGGLGSQLGLVVRGPSPGGLGADDIADALELPLIAAMRPEPGLERRVDRGDVPGRQPRSPLARAAGAVLRTAGVV